MIWKCSVCNFRWEGDAPPDVCPKCGNPKEKYAQMSDDDVALMHKARVTNELHIELQAILPRLIELAEEGIEDNLDAWCVGMFERLKSDAEFLLTSSKAELEGHVNKKKWG
jgi:hypothetical protein